MNLFAKFADLLETVKAGDIKGSFCKSGTLISTVACDTPMMAAAPAADAAAPKVHTEVEVKQACHTFGAELKACCAKNEGILNVGLSSDTTIPPGTWTNLAELVFQAILLFIHK